MKYNYYMLKHTQSLGNKFNNGYLRFKNLNIELYDKHLLF